MNFKVVENSHPTYDINEVIQDYTEGKMTVTEIKSKYGIGRSEWINLIKKFKKQGIPIRGRGRFVKSKGRRRIKLNDKTF